MPAVQAYRTIIVLDIEQYGRGGRDDRVRVELRRILRAATAETLAGADVPAGAWSASSTGDGLLVLVDPAVAAASVLGGVLDRLPAALTAHNRSATGPAQIRVRAVLHAGHIMLDDQGATGEQLNLAFRLLDSDGLRARLRAVTGPLVVGVSEDIYRQVVTQRPLGLDPATFAPVEVAVKEVRASVWVHHSNADGAPGGHDLADVAPPQAGHEPLAVPAPSQLPAPPPHFTGREEERRALDRLPAEADAAVRRMLDWYLASADAADRAVMPHRWRPVRACATPPQPPQPAPFDGAAAALEWLERERLNLLAAVAEATRRRWHPTAWQLVDAMWSLFLYHKHYREWVACHRTGIDSARLDGSRQAEALLSGHLGLAFHGLEDFGQAHQCFGRAAAMYRATGDRHGEASALSGLGLALHRLGRTGEAIEHFGKAAAIQRELQDRRGEALTLADLGRAHSDAGRPGEATGHLLHARAVFASLPDPYNQARTVAALAQTQAEHGQLGTALGHLEQAMTALRDVGSPYEQAQVLELLGDALRRLGDEAAGDHYHRHALALYQVVASPRARRLDARLRPARGNRQG